MPNPLTAYVTAQTVSGEFRRPRALSRAVDLMRRAWVGRVVLEGYRGGFVASDQALGAARERFEYEGFDTLGGIMPVHGAEFGKRSEGIETRLPTFCYTDDATIAALEHEIRRLARLFNEVVIDDAFLTSCRCDDCEAARGGRDWGAFRRDLLSGVAVSWVAAAREENPDVRLIVKFPQYYDRYHRFGYDASRFPAIFDAVWQGAETRDPATLAYGYVEPYQGYYNVAWMKACAGDRFEGAWFDSLDCDEQLFYEQAITTFLAAPKNVTVFCYGESLFSAGMMRRIAETLPALEGLRTAAVNPAGVHVIHPPNSDAGRDHYLFDYLGMLGIPCVPATRLEQTMRSVIIPAHAASHPDIIAAIPKVLMAGRNVIVTLHALRRLADSPSVLEFFGYHPSGIAERGARVERFDLLGSRVRATHPFHVAGDLEPLNASVLAWAEFEGCERGTIRVPLVTAKSFAGGGRAVVWNLDTFDETAFDIREPFNVPVKSELATLPIPVVDLLRQTATAPLGYTIKAPARVAVFVFAGHVVFVNYNPIPVEVVTDGLAWNPGSLKSDSPRTTCAKASIFLASRSYALLERH